VKHQKPIIHGRDHAAGGADPIPGVGGGIQFDTSPQVGGWLEVVTDDSHPTEAVGIFMRTSYGTRLELDDSQNTSNAFHVRNIEVPGDVAKGIIVDVEGTDANGIEIAVQASANGTGVFGSAVGTSASTSDEVFGGSFVAESNGGAIPTGVFGDSEQGDTDSPYGVGVWGVASLSGGDGDQIAGLFAAWGTGVSPSPSNATQVTRRLPSTGVLAYARGDTQDVAGLVVDVSIEGGGSGTAYPIRAWVGSSEVFRIDPDGDIHIPTGRSVVADL
jgi:hypothetical protein